MNTLSGCGHRFGSHAPLFSAAPAREDRWPTNHEDAAPHDCWLRWRSDVVDGDTSTGPSSSSTETAPKDETGTERERPRRRRYTVKLNDSLGSISEKTGVSVERLEALNPDLDPQALVVGQKIKLRE